MVGSFFLYTGFVELKYKFGCMKMWGIQSKFKKKYF